MLSAACAIGLGNVWRFPFITGKYGGGIFVVVYLLFLLAVLPVMIMEFAIGRASKSSLGKSFHVLEQPGTFWHRMGWLSLIGPYALMMFYTTISGWMLYYCIKMAQGAFENLSIGQSASFFETMLSNPALQVFWMTVCVATCFAVNASGLRNGVERVINAMMVGLFILLSVLVVRVLFLPGALDGLRYFLIPDTERFFSASFLEICNAAMCQAFFTLGIGNGCMATIGSYYSREKSLPGEALWVAFLDTFVAMLAGMLVFPACFSFQINPDSGPGLIFITLPHIFNSMSHGYIWGMLFFLFMTFASFSTVIAVFETIISHSQDVHMCTRKKACLKHGIVLWALSLPCALSWSVLSDVHPFGGSSTILDLEDFILSSNILPIGALLFTLFCTLKNGWGWDNFIREANQGNGLKLPHWFKFYLRWVLPVLLLFVFTAGYVERFWK
ncbi:MAG: sodium-dependent transporter [Desulfovibrio sp.]|nr:sodium-dependent transporter [Desulfovibrio sp.]